MIAAGRLFGVAGMERANPEVKLALSVERRLRRPAPQLRALLAAAERRARSETPGEALLSAADPLAVLAALLAAPDAGSAADRVSGRLRRLAPAAAMPEGRRGAVDAGRGGPRGAVPPRSEGIGQQGESPRMPATARVVSLPTTAPAGAALDRAGIAQSRAALRHVIAALPDVADTAHRMQNNTAQPPSHAPSDHRHGGAATAHMLVAAARGAERATGAGKAATAAAMAAHAMAADAMAVLVEGTLHAADLPAHAAAPLSHLAWDLTPGRTNAPARPVAVTHTPSDEGRAATGPAPAVAAPPPPAPRSRTDPMVTLDDGADALAEAAWRNGVDLSWP